MRKSIEELYHLFKNCSGVSTDTRSISNNCIFFALKGDNFNGNRFSEKALEAGAAYAIVDEVEYEKEQCILVNNVLTTLQELATYHRKKLTIPIIGLTGSNGKTTTKELMHTALNAKFKTQATKGNLNNHIGVPLSLLSITDEHEIAIIEMGANHQKEIEFLCKIAQPDIGYITNYGKAHMEGFGGIEGIIKGKTELYDFLRANNKKALINTLDKKQVEKSIGIQTIRFGSENDDYHFTSSINPNGNLVGLAYNNVKIHTQLTGAYNYPNLCAAVALALYFSVPIGLAKNKLESYTPSNNRSQLRNTEKNTLVLDAYNANPSSMAAAIENFETLNAISKWLILGDMFELGKDSLHEHEEILKLIATKQFEHILLAGSAFFQAQKLMAIANTTAYKTTETLLAAINEKKLTGKTVLIKGSRGMKLEQVVLLL